MKRTSWLEHPEQVPEINSATILPTTIKGLKMMAADYQKKGMRPAWRTTYFQYLSVVARLIDTPHNTYVLSDNTDLLTHQIHKRPPATHFLLRHHYYRFIFQISPYASDSLLLLALQNVTPEEISAHLAEAVQADLKSQLHQKLLINASSALHEKQVQNTPNPKDQVIRIIANRADFTAKDLEREVNIDREILLEILEGLSQEGLIGDMGNYFIVNREMLN